MTALDPARSETAVREPALPLHVDIDRTLRVKIIDACGLACTFCHNEGTPVVADNHAAPPGRFVGAGATGRVSIYLATNGARFLPAPVLPDEDFSLALTALRDALGVEELHLTGGEPTLHPRVAELVGIGREAGLTVCMTSNGERGVRVLPACAEAGLDRVNFSVFGTTPTELAQVQHAKFADQGRAERKMAALRRSIETALKHGVRASANIVVPNHEHIPRVKRLLAEYAPELSVRLLNSLDEGQKSIDAIEQALADLRATPVTRYMTAGASGCRTKYRLPSGREVFFKQIRRVRLPDTCARCRFNNDTDCHEGYYGVRLYRDEAGGFQVGVCIQRMDLCMSVEDFLSSDLRHEIIELRRSEYRRLTASAAA